MQYRNYRKRPKKAVEKQLKYYFFNGGTQYICNVTAPIEVQNYKIKEAFDRAFVGKKPNSISLEANPFYGVHRDIQCIISKVGEQ